MPVWHGGEFFGDAAIIPCSLLGIPQWRATVNSSKIVSIHEAETHLSKLLDQAHSGEEIILAKAGKPYARLMPLASDGRRGPGQLPDLVVGSEFFEPLPEEELRAWGLM